MTETDGNSFYVDRDEHDHDADDNLSNNSWDMVNDDDGEAAAVAPEPPGYYTPGKREKEVTTHPDKEGNQRSSHDKQVGRAQNEETDRGGTDNLLAKIKAGYLDWYGNLLSQRTTGNALDPPPTASKLLELIE